MRRYIQKRWGTRLMRLLWGKPVEPQNEHISKNAETTVTFTGTKGRR